MKRSLRPRSAAQYVSQQEWSFDEEQFVPTRRYNVFSKFGEKKYQDSDLVREMRAEDFTLRYVQESGLTHPLVFRESEGLGMKIPPSTFTVKDIRRLVGSKRVLDVVDTCTQEGSTMTMQQWTQYFESHPRKKLLNVISLEFSCTKLSPLVEPPAVVRELDWVEQVWPSDLKSAQTDPTNNLCRMMYPKVQKYCLMSVAGCYTDFHLDFGGTSVWYHIVRGEKLFLLIPPTDDNYSLFHTWQMSGEQEGVFFGELVEKAQLVRLKAGDTFIMPSGWIHGVYTALDSLVFGGNFLHSFNISQQLRVAEMERTIKVPSKFRYPFYGTIHWYVVLAYHNELTKRGVKVQADSDPADNAEDVPAVLCGGRRWLKGVELERVSVSSDTGSDKSGPIWEDSKPPCLSVHERGGLLVLLQSMREQGLFSSDVPPSCCTPMEVVESLQRQLHSSSLEECCPSRPNGLGLLLATPHSQVGGGSTDERSRESSRKRPRVRKSLTDSPRKQQKRGGGTRVRGRGSKASVVVSLPISLLSPVKSQGEEESECEPPGDTPTGGGVVPDTAVEGRGLGVPLTPDQLTPPHSHALITPPTDSPLVDCTSCTPPHFSLALEQESPYSLGTSTAESPQPVSSYHGNSEQTITVLPNQQSI